MLVLECTCWSASLLCVCVCAFVCNTRLIVHETIPESWHVPGRRVAAPRHRQPRAALVPRRHRRRRRPAGRRLAHGLERGPKPRPLAMRRRPAPDNTLPASPPSSSSASHCGARRLPPLPPREPGSEPTPAGSPREPAARRRAAARLARARWAARPCRYWG